MLIKCWEFVTIREIPLNQLQINKEWEHVKYYSQEFRESWGFLWILGIGTRFKIFMTASIFSSIYILFSCEMVLTVSTFINKYIFIGCATVQLNSSHIG